MDKLLTLEELANKLRISESCLRKLCRQGRIPHIAFGPRTKRFDPKVIESWLASVFDIGDGKNGSDQEAGLQQLDIPGEHQWQSMGAFNRSERTKIGGSQGSKALKIGRVASATARKLIEIEERHREGSSKG